MGELFALSIRVFIPGTFGSAQFTGLEQQLFIYPPVTFPQQFNVSGKTDIALIIENHLARTTSIFIKL